MIEQVETRWSPCVPLRAVTLFVAAPELPCETRVLWFDVLLERSTIFPMEGFPRRYDRSQRLLVESMPS
jgi:hypothetical protein